MQRSSWAPVLLLAAAALACSDNPSAPEGRGTVAFQLATSGTGGAAAPSLAISVTVGTDVLVVTDVQLVARKIKLEQEDGSCPADVEAEPDEEQEDECPTLKLGPLLLDPPIAEGVDPVFTVDLPAGVYDELQLQIHKPTSSNDIAFIAANPEFDGVSIRVRGTWNGTPFTFTSALTQVIEIELEDPIEVVAAGQTSLTLLLDVSGWFLGQGGGSLLSPIAPSQQDRSQIEQNIRQSFHAFEDEDEDGEADG
jgi:hypothetical protein